MTTATATKKPPHTRPPRKAQQKPKVAPTPAPVDIELNVGADEYRAIRAVAMAASNDDFRRVLTAIHVACDGESLTMAATDSYRLHRATLRFQAKPFEALIPATWLVKTLREVVRWKRLALVPLAIRDGHVTIRGIDETRSTNLITGDYPNTNALIERSEPDHHPDTVVGVNPKFFADVLKACELFGGETAAARFNVTDSQVKPVRFEVRHNGTFVGLIMPLRITDT